MKSTPPQSHSRVRVLLAACSAVAALGTWFVLEADPLTAREETSITPVPSVAETPTAAAAATPREDEKKVNLTFFNTGWPDVLERLASETDSTLVLHDTPTGRLNRLDRRSYTRTDAVHLLNLELEPDGYRILEQGRFLVVLHDERVRPRYPRPTTPAESDSVPEPRRELADESEPARDETAPETFESIVHVSLEAAHVTPVAKALHESLGARSRLENEGPSGLPAFRVTDASGSPVVFELDVPNNRLVVAGPRRPVDDAITLAKALDASARSGSSARLLRVEDPTSRLVAQLDRVRRDLGQTRPTTLLAQADPTTDPAPPADPAGPPAGGEPQPGPMDPVDLPGLVGSLKGDVSLEALQDLGVLILRGNEQDIAEVMRVVRQIELLSRGTTPDILLHKLRFVDSEALAPLLDDVYSQIDALQARGTAERKSVAVIPVAKPNAILVLAPEAMLASIRELAEQLDEPVDPRDEVQIFRLRSAVPTQVVELVEDFYEERPGLGTRVRVAADARTNSVIVQARPNDLVEIERLIEGLDRENSRAVSRVQILPLKNAVAEELAEVLNAAIESALGSSQTGGGGNTQFGEARSVVLEFLTADGRAEAQRIRSGLLANVRISADARSNTLIVTAPKESLDLVAALVARLDEPSRSVAEIKVFELENADATATRDLLEALFEEEQEGQTGVRLAGAEDSSGSLVPIRFSVDVRTNNLVAIGGADALRVVEAIVLRLDATDARSRRTQVIRLQNSPATDVATAVNNFLQSQRDLAEIDPELVSNVEILEREIIVVDEPITNSLLISATPRYFDEILQIVQRLDSAPRQVVIQALLVEVELDNTDELGVELGLQGSTLFDRSVTAAEDLVTLSTTNTSPNGVQTTTQNIVSQAAQPGFLFANPNTPLGNNSFGQGADPGAVGTQGLSNFSLGRVNGDLGYGGLVFSASSANVSVLIRALAARTNVHILSRPQIRTLDNLLAQIQVGQQVPVIDGVNINQLGAATPIIRQDSAGIILTVTPRIRDDDEIVMEVIAEKSAFDLTEGVSLFVDQTTGVSIDSPVKDITSAQTTVSVPTGQTVVIGGMITKADATIERKVPWIGDLPIVGQAFRYDSTTTQRSELLIFLTPRILDGPADSEVVKQIEAGRLHFIEEEAEAIHGPLFAVPAADPYGLPPELPVGDDRQPRTLPAPDRWEDTDVPTTRMPAQPTAPPAPATAPPSPPEPESGR